MKQNYKCKDPEIEQLAEIKHSDVGIRFSELSDVPNEYTESVGSFVKINDSGDGVSFTVT